MYSKVFLGRLPQDGCDWRLLFACRWRGFEMTAIDRIQRFLLEESGATAIEYGLITSLIAVAIISAITLLSGKMQNTFNEISSNLK
jgi:pilus assembly protein Flp/PilA